MKAQVIEKKKGRINRTTGEGITGTLDYKRDGFMKMMQDATQNKE